ncbi:MAG: AraC family transcriptional regulator [Oscillospiraceae bacterium]|nr:AraC family transcriptional regulator [Oscillospiraceae bacterium]
MIKKLEEVSETAEFNTETLFAVHHSTEAEDSPRHWHSAAEIMMPLKGGYDVTINDTLYRLGEFDIIIIPTGDIHEIRASEKFGERMVVRFNLMLLKSVKGLDKASFIFFKTWHITHDASPELHGTLKSLLLETLVEYTEQREYYEASISAKLIGMTVFMARKHEEDAPEVFSDQIIKRKAHIVNFNRCVEYINQHYKDDLSLESISGIAGFSKFHFTRWFKQFAGLSFYEYLTRVRIKVAESMLTNSETPITEIALESGFQSIATFNRVFKLNKSLTPTEYRNLQGNIR